MRFVYGDKFIKLTWLPVIAFFVIAIVPMELGNTLFNGAADPVTGTMPEPPKKIISALALAVTVLRFRRLPPFARYVFLATMAYIFCMALESYYRYGNFFMYPHVFGKFFVLFSYTAMYVMFRGSDEKVFTMSLFVLAGVFMFDIFVYYPQVMTIGSFMNIERGLHAGCVSLLMAVWLYAFNSYLGQPERKMAWLLFFFMLSAFILFLNHRTVWLTSITSMSLTLFLNPRRGQERYKWPAFTPVVLIPAFAVMIIFSYYLAEKPELLNNIIERVVDIEKVNERGTGKWRLEQFESYLPFVLDHPFLGMRFDGYELPVQFFAEQTNKEVFEANTGHHFHSFYMDNMFYVGLVGTLILASVLVYPIVRMTQLPVKVPIRLVGLAVWTLAALQYGLSYPVDDFHFGMAGFTLAGIDTYLSKIDTSRLRPHNQVSRRIIRRAARIPKPKRIAV